MRALVSITYIASGNVAFESKLTEASVKARLDRCLEIYAGMNTVAKLAEWETE
jgi:uncharacterized protein (DUF1697 family)